MDDIGTTLLNKEYPNGPRPTHFLLVISEI